MIRRLPDELAALVPWVGAALLWFVVIEPLRAEQATRLLEQTQVRRGRLKAERTARDAQALAARIDAAMAGACQASAEPAELRQRVVRATAALNLAPVSLSVTGGPEGGAAIDAAGSRRAVRELLRRLGDPASGGFLRSATIREKGETWSVSVTTGLIGPFPQGMGPAPSACAAASPPQEPPPTETPAPSLSRPRPPTVATPRLSPRDEPVFAPVVPEPTPPPFTLVAFLEAEGKRRVSVRVGAEIRVISVGDRIDAWTCVAIDRDEGAVFTSSTGGRLVLKAGNDAGR